jgi:hypothetical protein
MNNFPTLPTTRRAAHFFHSKFLELCEYPEFPYYFKTEVLDVFSAIIQRTLDQYGFLPNNPLIDGMFFTVNNTSIWNMLVNSDRHSYHIVLALLVRRGFENDSATEEEKQRVNILYEKYSDLARNLDTW